MIPKEYRKIHSFYLPVGKGRKMYVEWCGKKKNPPLFVLHGGPGYPIRLKNFIKYFPPGFRIINHDQMGCGKSTPSALETLKGNTTKTLIEDIEKLRKYFGYDKIFTEGYSWGGSLNLYYALKFPSRIKGMIVGGYGSFTTPMETSTRIMAPDIYYDKWMIGKTEKETCRKMVKGLLNPKTRRKFVKKASYEDKLFKLMNFKRKFIFKKRRKHSFKDAVIGGILESHYYGNKAFMPHNYILKNAHKLKNIPGTIVHGRYDLICSPENALLLSKKWKKAKLVIAEMSGHGINTPQMYKALWNAYKDLLKIKWKPKCIR